MDWATQTDDLSSYLSTKKSDDILHVLGERFALQRPSTNITQNILVTLQHKDSGLGAQYAENSEAALTSEEDGGMGGGVLPPHTLGVASDAFFKMIHSKEDQTIFIMGEHGSGKSTNRNTITRQLIDLARNGKKKSRVLSGAAKMEVALESFGTYQTKLSPSASGFGRYTEYQYSTRGRMVGVKLIQYGLNKARVTNGTFLEEGERPYHVFYQLLAGTSTEEKQTLHLTDPSIFAYVKGSNTPTQTLGRSGTLSRKLTLGRSKSVSKKTPTHTEFPMTSEDGSKFSTLRENLKSLGIGKRIQSQIFKVLSAILHLGNLVFVDDETKPQDAATVRNPETLSIVAELLSVSLESLKNSVLYKSKTIGRDTFSYFLKAAAASQQRDALAETLYTLLFTWIVEHINERLCKPESEVDAFVGVIDVPWYQTAPTGSTFSKLDTFFGNYVQEKIMHHVHHQNFDLASIKFSEQGLSLVLPAYQDNQVTVDLYDGTSRLPGLWNLLGKNDIEVPAESTVAKEVVANLDSTLKPNPHFILSGQCSNITTATGTSKALFGVRHYIQEPAVEYDIESFLDEDAMLSDFVALFRGSTSALEDDKTGTETTFIANLFSQKNGIQAIKTGKGKVSGVKQGNIPLRRPSMKHKKGSAPTTPNTSINDTPNSINTCQASVQELLDSIKNTRHWYIYCISAAKKYGGGFEAENVSRQLDLFNLKHLARFRSTFDVDFTLGTTYEDFVTKYSALLSTAGANTRSTSNVKEQVRQFINGQWWPAREVALGNTSLYLSSTRWKWIHNSVTRLENVNTTDKRTSVTSYGTSEQGSDWDPVRRSINYRDDDMASEVDSVMESEYAFVDEAKKSIRPSKTKANDIEMGPIKKKEETPNEIIDKTEDITGQRKCWVCCTWMLTWWVPSYFLECCGGMKRSDIRMAWREKLALCIIIFFMCCTLLFFIIGLRYVICPPVAVLTQSEVQSMSHDRVGPGRQAWFSVYGRYIYADDLMTAHMKSYGDGSGVGAVDNYRFKEVFYGTDVSRLFYQQDSWDNICPGIAKPQAEWDNMDPNLDWQKRSSLPNEFREIHRKNAPGGYPQQYVSNLMQYAKGRIGWSMESIKAISSDTKIYIALFDNVYYTSTMASVNKDVFPQSIRDLFGASNQGKDITAQWKSARNANPKAFDNYLNCINNLFYVGTVDRRNNLQCNLSNTLLFGASIVLVAVIGIKFLAALQFGSKKEPEQADKFAILMVPCYTEGVESLTKTLDSLATFRYDDKRKLLFVICDGMIIGSGNDRPTPRIVLDILGVDASQDPEPLAFHSIGEGNKQYNMGKIYSGLYEIRGHSVPFIVVVKCGGPKERARPGNRGKRDSQLILMQFLNRVHFNAEFSPMELEIYHQMKNIIGVSPSFYEFILMVDADTEVEPSSLNRMVSLMVHDVQIMGLCGETRISNEKDSWVTMIQVYEYFISHHLAKAFESLFGTVTCLPGCFSMYRIRSASKNVPVLVAPGVLSDYSENTVDTLHKKNLLHLGEDRYLTTLLLKHFPQMRTKFTGEARCFTVAPDRWSVLLSQRRRWINSTVHNLWELIALDQLCGFCCFSMRFIVMLDLFATFVQPATVAYIGYLIFAVATSREVFPLLSILLIASIYGFQIIIFIAKREWQHIMWMFIYLLAIPVISFYIPCYSFWNFDDFSWGNTRVVVGEGKKTVYIADSEPFDPKSIPLKRWREFEENDLWEQDSVASGSSFQSSSPRSRAPPSEYSYSPRTSIGGQYPRPPPSEYSVASFDNTPLRQNHLSMVSFGAEGPTTVPGPFSSQRNTFITDAQLFEEIKRELVGADLMTLTKKQIRDNLSSKLGVDLKPKKDLMNKMIDQILSGKD